MDYEQEQFECPHCGSLFGSGTSSCPGCGMAFEWDEEETEETLDELIEEATEASYDPSPGSEAVETPDEVTEPAHDPSLEAVEDVPSHREMEAPAEEAPVGHAVRRRALSLLGMAFAVLTVVSVIGLVVVLNYDTWIDGAEENNIGDTQIMYVYLGAAAIVVCLVVVVFDLLRNRRAV